MEDVLICGTVIDVVLVEGVTVLFLLVTVNDSTLADNFITSAGIASPCKLFNDQDLIADLICKPAIDLSNPVVAVTVFWDMDRPNPVMVRIVLFDPDSVPIPEVTCKPTNETAADVPVIEPIADDTC